MSRLSFMLRSLFLIGFVIAMPFLALPSVARRLDSILYGDTKSTVPVEGSSAVANAPTGDGIAQATFEVPLADSPHPRTKGKNQRGLDAVTHKPPELAQSPEFPSSPFEVSPGEPTGATNPATDPPVRQADFSSKLPHRLGPSGEGQAESALATRIGEIRQRLEDLGADYLLLEQVGGTGQYRFQCRMLVMAGGPQTESFEATGNSAVAVAEQVLKSVETWRASQASPPR